MYKLQLNLQRREFTYDLLIGDEPASNLSSELRKRFPQCKKILLLSDSNVLSLQRSFAEALFDSTHEIVWHTVPPGENSKSLEQLSLLWETMLKARLSRSDLLIAFGGGVVGDLGGFAAATYRRGILCVQIPTSLLAMVDSSVGGKTAINVGQLGKNMIGAFHQPQLVSIFPQLLNTLSEDHLRYGLAEVLKAAFLAEDVGLFAQWLKSNHRFILELDSQVMAELIHRAVSIKVMFVEADEFEQTGKRALLNLGHTFAHAIEAVSQYTVPHGAAVALGLELAFALSQRKGLLKDSAYCSAIELLRLFNMKGNLNEWGDFQVAELLEHMQHDKKTSATCLPFVLPVGDLGRCELRSDVAEGEVHDVLSAMIAGELIQPLS